MHERLYDKPNPILTVQGVSQNESKKLGLTYVKTTYTSKQASTSTRHQPAYCTSQSVELGWNIPGISTDFKLFSPSREILKLLKSYAALRVSPQSVGDQTSESFSVSGFL
ncbi:hypothetical protein ACFX13_028894 [Malus domestica]